MEAYVPHLDIIGEGAYEIDDGLGAGDSPNCRGTLPYPNAWVRWVAEQEISAIRDTGHSTAPNDRTPILIAEAFCTTCNGIGTVCPTAAGIRHDAFVGLAAGLKGILFYNWPAVLAMTGGQVAAISRVGSLILGQEGIGEWVLKGTRQPDLPVTVPNGPAKTPSFRPYGGPATSYPSVRAAAFDWAGERLIIAVNSSPKPVIVGISGLPAGAPRATVIGEARSVKIADGTIVPTESFAGLGVHIYKVPLVKKLADGRLTALQPSNRLR